MGVKSVDKKELEQLLNVIVQETSKAYVLCEQEDVKNIIEHIEIIASQAISAWDMQEFVEADGEDLHEFMEEANRAVGNFKDIEWEG